MPCLFWATPWAGGSLQGRRGLCRRDRLPVEPCGGPYSTCSRGERTFTRILDEAGAVRAIEVLATPCGSSGRPLEDASVRRISLTRERHSVVRVELLDAGPDAGLAAKIRGELALPEQATLVRPADPPRS